MKADWWDAALALRDLAEAICMSLICHPYVTRMYSYVIYMSLVCTRMSSACHSYVLVCHPYVTHMYSYVTRMYSYLTRMSLVCTRMSFVCYLYVLVCHSYVTRMYSYVIRMSLVCGFTMNLGTCGEIWEIPLSIAS